MRCDRNLSLKVRTDMDNTFSFRCENIETFFRLIKLINIEHAEIAINPHGVDAQITATCSLSELLGSFRSVDGGKLAMDTLSPVVKSENLFSLMTEIAKSINN